MRILKYFGVLLFVLSMLLAVPAEAQCPMCKSNIESTMKGPGRKTGLGLNKGIMVLFIMPYVAIGVVGLLWYKNSRPKKEKDSVFHY